MTTADLLACSARELSEAVRTGRLSATEILGAYLGRTAAVDPLLHAVLTLSEARASRSARRIDAAVRQGTDPGPLAGVPIAVKDNLSTKGLRTTCASRFLADFVPVYDATVVRRIEEAGAVLIGKTNLDEFAMGSSTEHSAFGPTRNPWHTGFVPGGSSGGSAAAVAGGIAPLALGTDTGGSVRLPGAFCGLVALKPQYGTVSRWGLVAFASSYDIVGVLSRDAEDCALLLRVLQGRDPNDSTGIAPRNPIEACRLDRPVRGMRLALPVDWLGEGLDRQVRAVLDETIEIFRSLGVTIDPVDLPDPRHAVSVYYIIANAEASSNLARFDGVRYGRRSAEAPDLETLYERSRGEGFGQEVKRRILLGTFVLSSGYYEAYYAKAQRVRERLRARYEEIIADYDALLVPTSPTPPFRLGERLGDPLMMYLSDLYTILANLLRVPAVSFPAGRSSNGLPIGLQLIGRPDGEPTLLRLVRAHESIDDRAGSVRGGTGPVTGPIDTGGPG